jgi:hypothetical protein
MQPPPSAVWNPELHALWRRIEQHDLEPDQALDFTRRLARDHAWTLAFARNAIAEYRRFCFLAVASADPVTPSEAVDEVWHLHLTYSRDYWDRWCAGVLCARLHHDPTLGGPDEQAKFRRQYALTLARYEAFFGPPSAVFWPATHERFAPRPRFRTIDGRQWLLLPHPRRIWQHIAERLGR